MPSFKKPYHSRPDGVISDRLVFSSPHVQMHEGHTEDTLVWIHRIRLRSEAHAYRAAEKLRKMQLPPFDLLVGILDIQPQIDKTGYFLRVLMERTANERTLQRELDELGVCNYCIRGITGKIVQGLSFIHSKGIAHMNLKPSSIVLGQRQEGSLYRTVKLSDQDYVRALNATSDKEHFHEASFVPIGSLKYLSPEAARTILHGTELSAKDARLSDTHALACVALQMTAGGFGFSDDKGSTSITLEEASAKETSLFLLLHLANGYKPVIPTGLSEPMDEFLNSCFGHDPTADDLLLEPFLKHYDPPCRRVSASANPTYEEFLQGFCHDEPTCNVVSILNGFGNMHVAVDTWVSQELVLTLLFLDLSTMETDPPKKALTAIVQQDQDLPIVLVTGPKLLLNQRILSVTEDVLVALVLKPVPEFSTAQLQTVNLPHLITIMLVGCPIISLVSNGFKHLLNLRAVIFRLSTLAAVHPEAFRTTRPLELVSVDSYIQPPLDLKATTLRCRPTLYIWLEERVREPCEQQVVLEGTHQQPYDIVDMAICADGAQNVMQEKLNARHRSRANHRCADNRKRPHGGGAETIPKQTYSAVLANNLARNFLGSQPDRPVAHPGKGIDPAFFPRNQSALEGDRTRTALTSNYVQLRVSDCFPGGQMTESLTDKSHWRNDGRTDEAAREQDAPACYSQPCGANKSVDFVLSGK